MNCGYVLQWYSTATASSLRDKWMVSLGDIKNNLIKTERNGGLGGTVQIKIDNKSSKEGKKGKRGRRGRRREKE